ncbi:MAG: hypothetical protein WAO12_10855, partial [Venatoribacter sp.]
MASAPPSLSFPWDGRADEEGEWFIPQVAATETSNGSGVWEATGLPESTKIEAINLTMRKRAQFTSG